MTFFEEHYDFICEHATNWALNIAHYTRDYSSVPDYRQQFLLYIWQYCEDFDPSRNVHPHAYIVRLLEWARGKIYEGMNTHRELFWENILYLEDFAKKSKNGSWEDFIRPSDR